MSDKPVGHLFRIDDQIAGGQFSNIATVWHTGHEFTLDFAVTEPAEDNDDHVVVPTKVVARIKMPVSVIFSLAQAIATNVDNYEKAYGPIRVPEPQDRGGKSA